MNNSFCNYTGMYANNGDIVKFNAHDNALSFFFRKYLMQKAVSVFKWKVPKTWDIDYFLFTLYELGHVAVVNTDKYGVIPQLCGLSGMDVFYRPTHATISNPILGGFNSLRIHTQCTLFKMNPDYSGIYDLVSFYGDMLAICAQTAGVNLVNSKLSYVFSAKNKASAESLKKLYDNIASGHPASVVDSNLFNTDGTPAWQAFQQNVGQNYIAGDILEDMRKWELMFDTDIGIPNANTDKKERMLTAEVNANNTETSTKCERWLDGFKAVCEETRKMFDIDIEVDWRVRPHNDGGNNDERKTGNIV